MKIPPSSPKAVQTTPVVETHKPTGAAALAVAGAAISTESFRPASSGAPPADIEGASAGYTSPTKVESPFSPEEKKTMAAKIPCPALAGMFNAGMLKVEKDGTV